MPLKIIDLFKRWLGEYRKSVYSCIWTVFPSIVVWEIWKEKNKCIFQGKEESSELLCARVEREISEVVSASTKGHNFLKFPFSMANKLIQTNWPLLKFRPVHGQSGVDSIEGGVSNCVRSKPEQGWVKINFDGASRGNLGISGVGCVACDVEGKILMKGAQRLQDGTNNEAHAQEALLAIELGCNLKVSKLHLEGDSKIIVDAISKGPTPSWQINSSQLSAQS
ncbi:uncharacterized protein LOC131859330 [Cryptomeria japonica]|uniref:uncharacterized protein LOC131859330 n=1 Tax=Cryptomeria japonica TaxID=3369 RepID=UPI0027D9D477|nr:uncharacterized protein LOC131859330 [Cryptomeria japonica]